MLKLILILLVITAIFAVQTRRLRRSIVFLGVFSLSISFAYMLYQAPDVAVAEAVIGCTISVILFVVALQQYKLFTIYYVRDHERLGVSSFLPVDQSRLIRVLEKFCAKQELEPQIIYSDEMLKDIINTHPYALIIEERKNELMIYGHPENYKLDALETFLQEDSQFDHPYRIVKVEEMIL